MINLAQLLPHIDATETRCAMGAFGPSHEEEVQAARDEATAAATAAAEAQFALRLGQIAEQQSEELRAARQRWSEEEAVPMTAQLLAAVADAEFRLADAIKAVLMPFVGALLPRAALQQLEECLLPALATDLGGRVTLQGPADLVQQLAANLAAKGATNIVFGPASAPELRAECNGVLAVTRLADWCDAMRETSHG